MKVKIRVFSLVLGLLCSLLVYALSASEPRVAFFATDSSSLQKPPPALLYHVASMGRPEAAADLLWLQVVSFIGLETNESKGYPGLEHYLDRITDLAPSFELPYWIGGILLATSPGRSGAADLILKKGEERYPNNWEFSQWRGFAAYFGEMNIDKALVHYKNAISKPGYPPYLKSFVQRLEQSKNDCRFLAQSLEQLLARKDNTTSFLNSKSGKIIKGCLTLSLKQAAASYRLKEQKVAINIAELLKTGYLKDVPPAPPGYCWAVLGIVELLPCKDVDKEQENYLKSLKESRQKKSPKQKDEFRGENAHLEKQGYTSDAGIQ